MEHNFRFKISKVWLKRIAIGAGALFALMVFFYFSILLGLWGKLPNKEELGNIKQAEASLVLDSNDKLVGKYFIFDRQLLQYESLPEHLINALIATEDVRFYEHEGVDYRSL
ncbi:MAG: transglycosylase domain-containing protein, partial [Flavobacteriaceae bacterium]|nr:transglycosylase domain-containing protein [Flavobacteriaceae bacterium]